MFEGMTKWTAIAMVMMVSLAAGCATGGGAEGGAETTAASEEASRAAKAAFGVRKPKHVGVALMSAHDMLHGEASQSVGEVAIVACGPAIRALATDSKFADRVHQGLDEGVKITACGVTVDRMGFDADRFIEGVEVVPNGFIELIRLQELGYHSVEL
jgi:intracellular sulfur oxidation DsrE/DsrF family protein